MSYVILTYINLGLRPFLLPGVDMTIELKNLSTSQRRPTDEVIAIRPGVGGQPSSFVKLTGNPDATSALLEEGTSTVQVEVTPAQLKSAIEAHAPAGLTSATDAEIVAGLQAGKRAMSPAQLKLAAQSHSPAPSAMSNAEAVAGTSTISKTLTAAQLKLAVEAHSASGSAAFRTIPLGRGIAAYTFSTFDFMDNRIPYVIAEVNDGETLTLTLPDLDDLVVGSVLLVSKTGGTTGGVEFNVNGTDVAFFGDTEEGIIKDGTMVIRVIAESGGVKQLQASFELNNLDGPGFLQIQTEGVPVESETQAINFGPGFTVVQGAGGVATITSSASGELPIGQVYPVGFDYERVLTKRVSNRVYLEGSNLSGITKGILDLSKATGGNGVGFCYLREAKYAAGSSGTLRINIKANNAGNDPIFTVDWTTAGSVSIYDGVGSRLLLANVLHDTDLYVGVVHEGAGIYALTLIRNGQVPLVIRNAVVKPIVDELWISDELGTGGKQVFTYKFFDKFLTYPSSVHTMVGDLVESSGAVVVDSNSLNSVTHALDASAYLVLSDALSPVLGSPLFINIQQLALSSTYQIEFPNEADTTFLQRSQQFFVYKSELALGGFGIVADDAATFWINGVVTGATTIHHQTGLYTFTRIAEDVYVVDVPTGGTSFTAEAPLVLENEVLKYIPHPLTWEVNDVLGAPLIGDVTGTEISGGLLSGSASVFSHGLTDYIPRGSYFTVEYTNDVDLQFILSLHDQDPSTPVITLTGNPPAGTEYLEVTSYNNLAVKSSHDAGVNRELVADASTLDVPLTLGIELALDGAVFLTIITGGVPGAATLVHTGITKTSLALFAFMHNTGNTNKVASLKLNASPLLPNSIQVGTIALASRPSESTGAKALETVTSDYSQLTTTVAGAEATLDVAPVTDVAAFLEANAAKPTIFTPAQVNAQITALVGLATGYLFGGGSVATGGGNADFPTDHPYYDASYDHGGVVGRVRLVFKGSWGSGTDPDKYVVTVRNHAAGSKRVQVVKQSNYVQFECRNLDDTGPEAGIFDFSMHKPPV